jgi:hypothetical protein
LRNVLLRRRQMLSTHFGRVPLESNSAIALVVTKTGSIATDMQFVG